jgi:hypothetical protein
MGTALERSESETHIFRKAQSYRIESESVDGMVFIDWVAALHRQLGVEIPELDYPRLRSLGAAAEYLEAKMARP